MGHGHIVGIGSGFLSKHLIYPREEAFREFTSQLDVHTATCHVGGDRHRAKGTGAGDDERFFSVLARVQHLVGDAAVEQGFETLPVIILQVQQSQQIRLVAFIRQVERAHAVLHSEPAQFGHAQFVQSFAQHTQFGLIDIIRLVQSFGLKPCLPDQLHLQQTPYHVSIQAFRKPLGVLNRGGANQLRATDDMVTDDFQDNCAHFSFCRAVNHIRIIFALVEERRFLRVRGGMVIGVLITLFVPRLFRADAGVGASSLVLEVCRDGEHVQTVNAEKLFFFGQGGTGHAR